MDLFKLVGKIVVDNSEANKALDETSDKAKETADDIGDMAESSQKSGGKVGGALKKVGSVAVGAGKVIATGLAAGGAAMGALTVKALNLGGELEQNMGGSEQVFKEHAAGMQETAKKAFSNMGLSTSDFLGTANKMGALFQGAGFDIETSATMSADAMQRAADVASIMGIDTASAMEAIAGAAKGNFTMMDNLGVAMNDTTLQAYALEKGITKSTQEMTNQEKIGLAMEMFMEKTAYAAGNYAKENETLAGSLGTAKAAFTNFLDGSGDVNGLVDALSNAANVIVKNITDILPRLVSGLTQLVDNIVPLIPPLLQSLLPGIVEGAVALVNGLVAALPSILQALMGALPALLEGVRQIFVAIVQAFPQLLDILVAALPSLVEMVVAMLPSLIPIVIDALVNMIVTICTNFAQIIQPLIDYLPDIIISLVNALMSNLPALIQGLISLVLGIVAAIPQIIQGLIDALPTVIESIVTGLLNSLPALIMGAIQLVIGIVRALPQILSSLKQALPNAMKGIWEAVKNVFSNVGKWFGDKFKGAKDAIVNAWSNVKSKFSNIKDGVVNAFSNIKEKLSKPFEKARDAIKKVADKIKGFFKGEIKMPKIKLPHFGISPKGWKIGDLLEGSIPKLKVSWYAKGGIMKEPTMFDFNPATMRAKVGGEAGDEAIAPIDTLQQYIRAAVQAENAGLAYMLERIIELLVQFFPEMLEALDVKMYLNKDVLVAETAADYDSALGKIAIKKGRGR